MLPNQIIQKVVNDIRKISGHRASLWTPEGEYVAITSAECRGAGKYVSEFLQALENGEISEESDTREWILEEAGLFGIYVEDALEYILAVQGSEESALLAGRFGVSVLTNLIQIYRERMDRNRFMQNLILDNMLVVDIYNQAKKMRIASEQRRVVFVVESKQEGENLILETMREMFGHGNRDFVTAVDERGVILVKSLEPAEEYPELLHLAETIVDTLSMEAMVSTRVAYGTIVDELKEVSRSYKEASMALEVGRVFYEERSILGYNELGIGRLIHQLPKSLCELFLKEVLAGNASDLFDDEELLTVYTFFDNNLNISETARKLFIHRNTLTYRLEKIQKKTGLDVRVFDDALTFKIAVMVERHLRYINNH